MDSILVKGYAKINISLDVLGKLPNGYHEVEMVMESLDFYDEIVIEKIAENKILLECNKDIGPIEDNLVYKAAKLIIDKYELKTGVSIKLNKQIFVAAGLAGGSTDAASTLKGMIQLFDIHISEEDLDTMGALLGADVTYCLHGSTMLASGIGEVLTPLPKHPKTYVLLAKPPISILTKDVFGNLDFNNISTRPKLQHILTGLENKDSKCIAQNFVNVLETVTIPKFPIVKQIKDSMLSKGALGALMSGSGPTVFGYFEDEATMEVAYQYIQNQFPQITEIKKTQIL